MRLALLVLAAAFFPPAFSPAQNSTTPPSAANSTTISQPQTVNGKPETSSPLSIPTLPSTPLPLLKISPNGRFFITDNGTPFFYLGDTAWGLFPHATRADAADYLADRASKGFTVIQTVIALWDAARRPDRDGEHVFIDNDPTKPNEAYFQNVDYVVNLAAAHGLYVAILPFWLKGEATNIRALLDPATAEWFCHYLGWRYRDKPVIWILGGDTAGQTATGPDYLPLVRAMAAGLRAGDGGAHLITYHPTGKQSSSFWFQNESWLSFNFIQSGHFIQNTNYEIIAADYLKTPAKPVVDGEPGYENITDRLIRDNPAAVRIAAPDVRRYGYLGVFAGAAGDTYGNGEVYEFWEPGGATLPGWAAGLPWRQSLQLPGSSQMQYLRWLIQSRPMLTRIPDQNLLTTETYRTTERIEGTRASDGSYAFIYSAAGKPFTVRTSLLSGTTLRAWWYSPRDGASTLVGEFPKADTHDFTPPSSGPGNDWVLVLDDASANFPPPGTHAAPAPTPEHLPSK
jgi:hypothetical protein